MLYVILTIEINSLYCQSKDLNAENCSFVTAKIVPRLSLAARSGGGNGM